ncbi:hypothetical protein TSOC_002278 [Tetrabaena socialis]|uniref:Uncharacterized protein n=1 Tax=Tetrabaena socialis TaxID=47790 RepID=A0A2J8AEJ4_9CHLO|nr:hypothetical protein TSOC_002278 [Tetrabaena socialis]|eukprot:PNH10941.1 hypothetical protein TSOC_002278 [Tetrabaena socialis]
MQCSMEAARRERKNSQMSVSAMYLCSTAVATSRSTAGAEGTSGGQRASMLRRISTKLLPLPVRHAAGGHGPVGPLHVDVQLLWRRHGGRGAVLLRRLVLLLLVLLGLQPKEAGSQLSSFDSRCTAIPSKLASEIPQATHRIRMYEAAAVLANATVFNRFSGGSMSSQQMSFTPPSGALTARPAPTCMSTSHLGAAPKVGIEQSIEAQVVPQGGEGASQKVAVELGLAV